jgi:glutamate--cysteine ligase
LDFKNNLGLENLANIAENLLNKISKKYQEYNIPNKPYCFIKAENGTYGMGVWAIESPNDILTINKKERNKMNILKGSVENHQVIIQEGILTTDKINNHPSEPLIYMLQAQIIELLYRCNQNRNELKSLNSPGAEFYNSSNLAPNNFMDKDNNFGLVCEFIAKIASLASSIENKNFNL